MLTSQSFELANEVGLAFTSAVRVPVERATGLNTRAHNSEKDMTDPVLRRISTIYIRIQSIYSRKTGCSPPKVSN